MLAQHKKSQWHFVRKHDELHDVGTEYGSIQARPFFKVVENELAFRS